MTAPRRPFAFVFVLFLASSCADRGPHEEGPRARATEALTTTGPREGDWFDREGRHWRGRRVDLAGDTSVRMPGIPSEEPPSVSDTYDPTAWRPVRLDDDLESVLVEEAPVSRPPLRLPDLRDLTTPTDITPEEDVRDWVDHTTAKGWPYRAQISLAPPPYPMRSPEPLPHCSATLIGRHTAISAAHCFYDRDRGAWRPTWAWAAGVVRTETISSWDYDVTSSYGPVTGCYSVTIPKGFITLSGSTRDLAPHDLAVIDFRGEGACGLEPGRETGWVSAALGKPVDYATAPSWIIGYDVESPEPPDRRLGAHPDVFAVPSLIERRGRPFDTQVASWSLSELESRITVIGGASGSGHLQQLFSNVGDPTWYWVGVVTNSDHKTTLSLRNTPSIWGFITDHTTEW